MSPTGALSEPTFSIVVPTFLRPASLRETLSALLALDYPSGRYEVIVVDDGADESTAGIVAELAGRGASIMLETQHRRGAARARNQGARLASGDWVLFCDDDILTPRAHLREHVAAHQRHHDAVVSGAWELAPPLATELRKTPFGRYRIELEQKFGNGAGGKPLEHDPGSALMPLLSAADISLRRELFWTIGGFDEDFPVAGAEDQDLSLRARAGHAQLVLDTKIRCFHNDHHLSLRAYCEREERYARTMTFMVRKHPAEFADTAYARENRPIDATDPPRLVAKKLLKAAGARDLPLELLHRLTRACEAADAPERLLRRAYTALLGLHLFRGFRRSW